MLCLKGHFLSGREFVCEGGLLAYLSAWHVDWQSYSEGDWYINISRGKVTRAFKCKE